MTRKQEYLAHDMDAETIEYCESEAQKMEKISPWTPADTELHAPYHDYTCWFDLILDCMRMQIEYQRGQYCAQMEE